jgi:putative peptidoglycan lipid II flippase
MMRGLALGGLVGAGVALYGLACFLTGAFRFGDLKTLLKRRTREA